MKEVCRDENIIQQRWNKLQRTIDYDCGIVKMLLPGYLALGDPGIYSYAGVMANTKAYGLHQCNQRNGGAGFTDAQAKISAVGECLERYCAAFYDPKKFIFGSWEELGNKAIHPSRWCLFTDKQYELFRSKGWGYVPFTPKTRIKWTQGWSLSENCHRYVPAQMVYIPYKIDENESVISPSISTGMSFGFSYPEAICYGLYEQFERDALSLWWLWRLPLPNLNLSHPSVSELCAIFSKTVSKFWVKYLRLDFTVHVFCVLGISLVRMPSGLRKIVLIMGSAARLDPLRALKKAFLEMGQAAPFYRYLLDRNPEKQFSPEMEDLLDFDDHAYYWLMNTEKNQFKLDFLENGPTIDLDDLINYDLGNPVDNVKFMVEELKRKGIEAVAVDLTTFDLREIGVVCKVLIPEFQPLEGAHLLRHLGGKRTWSVPVELGYYNKPLNENFVNPLPHPSP